VALIIMFSIKQIRGSWTLRIDKDGELEGLDITEHGTPAYHMEFGYGMSYTTPTGANVIGGGRPLPIDLESETDAPQKV
jgi:ammonia channel protein AmtB